MPASALKDIWLGVAHDQGIQCADIGSIAVDESPDSISHLAAASSLRSDKPTLLIGCAYAPVSCDLMKAASCLLQQGLGAEGGTRRGLICVTGSLHMVSSVLQQLQQ